MKPGSPAAFNHGGYTIGYASVANVVATSVFTVLVFSFYMAHYAWSTGFFTSAFTPSLAVLFFASVLYPITTAVAKVITSSTANVAFLEPIGAALFTTVAAWFFLAFTLNFAHLTDVIPTPIQFLFVWVDNDIGRIIVALALIGGVIAVTVDSIKLAWRVFTQQHPRLRI